MTAHHDALQVASRLVVRVLLLDRLRRLVSRTISPPSRSAGYALVRRFAKTPTREEARVTTTTSNPIIETDDGPVRGERSGGVERFLGIPYAAPPVGLLRLQAPARPRPWRDVFDATRFGPTAPQQAYANQGGLPDVPEPIIAGDDFLNVNVWTTGATEAPKPVLVWIHGGG